MNAFDIDVAACRGRQRRLLAVMEQRQLDLLIVTQTEHVQWLAGPRFAWVYQPAAALAADGQLTLVAPNDVPEVVAADRVVTYEAQWKCTLRNDQRQASTAALIETLGGQPLRNIGIERSSFAQYLTDLDVQWVDIEPDLYRLRRRKDADELRRIIKAIRGTERMYQRAREIIEPGISELTVFNELQSAAVEEFGEMLTGTGNDYQCASPGGPPRAGHTAQAGELYILDLGPAFQGYFADNCRTIAVTDPTDIQRQAWNDIVQIFQMVESTARPGTRCADLFHQAQETLDKSPVGQFTHHLGHGIGLFPHEAPHLNPHWDDQLEVDDVFTVEPGLYDPELRAGIRIENNYVVTADGVQCLTNFNMEL